MIDELRAETENLREMEAREPMLTQELSERKFEFDLSAPKNLYYTGERQVCHWLLRRPPPKMLGPYLLNLGCGPHIYPGWVNADDYAPKRRLRERQFRPNWHLDITKPWKCSDDRWDGIFTEHVIEHVTYSQAMFVLRECLRTLKLGTWLRISVPDLAKYVRVYREEAEASLPLSFPHPALAVSFLTQMHLHKSTWDSDLMIKVLTELGFKDAQSVDFGIGNDQRLIQDDKDKKGESLYVEARKR
jgi:predicted SAM-dependent methyltransferase